MTSIDDIIQILRRAGERITPVRQGMIRILVAASLPLSAQDMQDKLKKQGKRVNKTTVYRELEFLKKNNLIHEVEFGDRTTRYELSTRSHHHHSICVSCRRVQDVQLDRELDNLNRKIEKQQGFKVSEHFLEFFGLCEKCLKKENQ